MAIFLPFLFQFLDETPEDFSPNKPVNKTQLRDKFHFNPCNGLQQA